MCLAKRDLINPQTYIIDPSTGAKIIHFTGHFGKLKALKALIEQFSIDPLSIDYYKLTVAHYAARSGELAILVYLRNNNEVLNA